MKILTLNLRHHRDRWEERFPLVVDVLRQYQPDIIGFQEVWVPIEQGHMILDQLPENKLQLQVVPKQGKYGQEGIAIASRYPIISHESLDLPGDERVGQRAILEVEGTQLCFANTHLHDKPADESIRLPQMQALLQWLRCINLPTLLTGDMNARPDSSTILAAKEMFQSAYEVVHNSEPEATCPTPLAPHYQPDQGSTIDYVFCSRGHFRVEFASVVANKPDPNDERLYPSDHYGVLATIEL